MALQRIKGNWATCISQLGKQKPATAAEVMKDRIQRGVNDKEHFNFGAWTAENFNVVNRRILAARPGFNPLILYAEQAVKAYRAGKEFYLTSKIVDSKGKPYTQLLSEIAEADSKKPIGKRRVADLGQVATHAVPTDSCADDDAIVFLAQGKRPANKYGLFLKNKLGFDEVTVFHSQLSEKDFARGSWLGWLGRGDWSCFYCDYGGLDGGDGSVFRVSDADEVGGPEVSGPKVRIPTIGEVRKFAKQYISPRDRKEFEAGLRRMYEKE